jgi:hypothetical protein
VLSLVEGQWHGHSLDVEEGPVDQQTQEQKSRLLLEFVAAVVTPLLPCREKLVQQLPIYRFPWSV